MASKSKSTLETDIPELAPCFNCGKASNFLYDPGKDDLPVSKMVNIRCPECGVCGPVAKSVKEAMELWNNLYLMSQTAKVYNTLAKVSSPAEFAIWMQGLLEQVKGLDETKMTIAQREMAEKFSKALREAMDNSVDALKQTAEAFGTYTWTVNQIPVVKPPGWMPGNFSSSGQSPEKLTRGEWKVLQTPVGKKKP